MPTIHVIPPEGDKDTAKMGIPKRADVNAWHKMAWKSLARKGYERRDSFADVQVTEKTVTFSYGDGLLMVIDRKREGVEG